MYNNDRMESRKCVMVTGANGLLGANVIEELLKRNIYHVKGMVRKGADISALAGLHPELIEIDAEDIDALKQSLAGCHYVIHSAADTSQFPADKEKMDTVNIGLTKTLLSICRNMGAERFVFVSTANCFGGGSKAQPGNETSGFLEWMKDSHYAYSKYRAQNEVIEFSRQNNFPAIIVAPCFLVGPRDAKPSSGRLWQYAMKHKVLLCPPGGKSFVDVQYAAEAIVNALTYGKNGESYLIAGENLSYKEFFNLTGTVTGKKKFVIALPRGFFKFLALFNGILRFIVGKSWRIESVHFRMLCQQNYFSGDKARHELLLRNSSAAEALTRAISWFVNKGN